MSGQNTRLTHVAFLLVLGMLLTSCAPPAAPTATARTAPEMTKPAVGAPTPTPKPAGEQPRYGGVLTTATRLSIPHFDMHQETGAVQFPLASCYSMLVQNDPFDEDKVIADLAKSWDISSDGLTYTFQLQEGVKFHDGKPLTSQDVEFNLNRVISPPKGMLSARKELYQEVDKIEPIAPMTLRITLKRRQASFLQLLALPFNFVFAPEVVKQKGDMKRDVLGTGPFKLQSYNTNVSLKVQKNPDYFVKGRPYLDNINIYVIPDETARLAALRTRQVLMLPISTEITGPRARELQKSEPRLVVQERVQTSMTTLIPNTQMEPCSDVRVRQAVNLLIDREAAGKVVRAGGYYPGYGYVLPGSVWSLPEMEMMAMPGFRKPKDQDIAEAKRLLSEAGYPNGFKTTLMTSTSVHAKETAEFSKEQLAKIRIAADVRVLELAVAKDRLFSGAFEIVSWAQASGHDDPDVILGEYYLSGSPKNYGAWSNQKFDDLYDAQSVTLDAAKRKEVVWEMQRIIHREVPRVVVTWAGRAAIWWEEMKGWEPGRTMYSNHKFQDVWLTR